MQQPLRNKRPYFSSLLLIAILSFFYALLQGRPFDGVPTDSPSLVELEPVKIDPPADGWRVHGAWQMTSEDARFGGISGLARDDDALVAITDYARIISFAAPAAESRQLSAAIHTLRGGDGWVLKWRDGEALTFAPDGKMWVGIERYHALHRYGADRNSHEQQFDLAGDGWPDNGGVEALVSAYGDEPMLALVERRPVALAYQDGDWNEVPVRGGKGWPTGGARLADGRIIILTRALGPGGFTNRVALARWTGDAVEIGPMVTLDLGWLDNMEGIATAPLPNGATRLWLISDDNTNWYQRSVLVAYDVEADAWP